MPKSLRFAGNRVFVALTHALKANGTSIALRLSYPRIRDSRRTVGPLALDRGDAGSAVAFGERTADNRFGTGNTGVPGPEGRGSNDDEWTLA